MKIKFANKVYVLSDSAASFKEIARDAQSAEAYFVVKSFKKLDEGKIKVKIAYLDRKFRFATVQQNSCCWKVQSFLARKSGGINGLKSNFYYSYTSQ